MKLPACLLLFFCVQGFDTEQKQVYLTKDKSGACQTTQLGEPWTAPSPVACFAACNTDFPETCRSIVYNEATHICTPGGTAFTSVVELPTSIPDPTSGDLLFYQPRAIPACNNSRDFALYEMCGTTLCLYLSTSGANYETAVRFCEGMNSNLFVTDTWPRFSLFWSVSLYYINQDTTLDLTDIVTEGHFVWGNGEALSEDMKEVIWVDGQPDNNRDGYQEHCVQARHFHWPGVFGLNDMECSKSNYFICESNV